MTESVPASENAERIRRVQEEAGRRGLDGVLAWSKSGGTVDAFADVFYLTNWYSPFPRIEDQPPVWAGRAYGAVYVPADGAPTLIVDVPDYRRDLVAVDDVRAGINVPATAAKVIAEHGAANGTIGLAAAETMLLGSWRQLEEALPGARFQPADDILMSLRMTKSPREVELLRRAARVGSEMVAEMLRTAQRPGVTEAEAVAAAWKVAIEAGAAPWDSAVASGPNSDYYAWKGSPSWSDRRLEPGDIFHSDNYGTLDGYFYDLSRSCVCGEDATADQREVLDGAIGCVEAIIAEVRPGLTAGRLYDVGSGYLAEHGLAGDASGEEVSVALVSSFPAHGHGLGLSFESPWLRKGNGAPIEEGMVLAIETMAGREGVGAAKFEQDVLVTATGAELLTDAQKVWWR